MSEGHYPDRLARDIRELTRHLELPRTALVGWSMGALQVLTAVEQFGTEWLSAVFLVDEVLGYPPNAWDRFPPPGEGKSGAASRPQGRDRSLRTRHV